MNHPYQFAISCTAILAFVLSSSLSAEDAKLESVKKLVFQLDQEVAADRGLKINAELLQSVGDQAQVRLDQVVKAEAIDSDLDIQMNHSKQELSLQIPGDLTEKQFAAVKASLLDSAWIEFALLANEVQHADLIALSRKAENKDKRRIYKDQELIGLWCSVALDEKGQQKIGPGGQVATRESLKGNTAVTEYLVVVDPDPETRLTNRFFENVEKQKMEFGLAISFKFNREGAALMEDVTSRNMPASHPPTKLPPETADGAQEEVPDQAEKFRSRLAIIIDGKIHMAPTINGVISASGVIQGNFEDSELDSLIRSLNREPLDVPLQIISEE